MSGKCCPTDDAAIVEDVTWRSEGGRWGWRRYRRADGTGWDEFWGTRIEDWGTRVFGTLYDAQHFVNTREG